MSVAARLYRVSAEDMKARGLPPLEITIDLEGTSLMGSVPSAPGYVAHFGGPPGGPLGASVEIVPAGAGAPTMEQLVRERFDAPGYAPLRIGVPTVVELGGAKRAALPFVTGRSRATMSQAAVIVDFPGKDYAALVLLGADGREPDALQVLAHPSLSRFARSIRFKA